MRPSTAQEGHLLAHGYPLDPRGAPRPLDAGVEACTLGSHRLGRAGERWGAVANRSQLALWLQYELGLPAAELEPRCTLEQLPLASRGTRRPESLP